MARHPPDSERGRLTSFAEQLRRYRRERELTQESLAERSGLSARGIRALESGERGSPHRDTVRLLADALELSRENRVAFEEAAARAAASEAAPRETSLPVGNFVGAVPAGPIIARQEEVGSLLSILDAALDGQGRLVMLGGEPGVGKTRLAQEVMLVARNRAALVAGGRCYEPEQSLPYYPFLEAVTALHSSADAAIRDDVPGRWPYLEWLLPDRPRAVGATEMGGHDMQQRLFWAVSGFIQAAAERQAVVLVLDDLHWADASSLHLLQHVARHTRGSPVLVLGTYRNVDVERQQQLQQTLRDLHREGLLEEIRVRGLDQSGTAALAADLLSQVGVSQEFGALVHQHTEGNPFFIKEVVRALVERGDIFFHDGTWDRRAVEEIEVPPTVRIAIGERVSRLSNQTQEVLHEASVLGQIFNFDDLARMTGRSEEETEEALGEASATMLVRVADRDEYVFDHALTRQTLYAELLPRRRNRLHGAVGEALEQLPEPARRRRAAHIAWHFLHADRPERALPFLMLAGDEAEVVFAHAEAERHYRTALDLADRIGDRHQEAEALAKLGTVLRMVSRYDEALTVLERATRLAVEAGEYEMEARATHEIGFVHFHRGTLEQGIGRVQAMIERLERLPASAQPHRALADLYSALALDLWPLARYTEVLSAVERAAAVAGAERDVPSRPLCETLRGMGVAMIGPLPEARRVLQDAVELSEASGNRWWVADGVADTGRVHLDEGRFSMGREHLERARALIEAVGDGAEMAWVESNLGEAAYLVGEWMDARAYYELAVQMARSADAAMYLSYALLHLAELCAAEGNWEQAWQYIEEGQAVGQRCGAVPAVRKSLRLLAEHDLIEGSPRQAIARLQTLLASLDDDWSRAFPPPVLAEAYLADGQVSKAAELAAKRIEKFRAQDHRRALALWLRIQGIVLGQQQLWKEADGAFEEAIGLARAMPYPYAEGRTLYELGASCARRGEVERAHASLATALVIFQDLGAGPDEHRTEQLLHDTGGGASEIASVTV